MLCGVMSTFGKSQKGLSGGSGSVRNTSRAARREVPVAQRRAPGRLVDKTAAGDVDQDRAAPHRAKLSFADHRVGLGGLRRDQHHEIARLQDVQQVVRPVDGLDRLVGRHRVAAYADDAHTERVRQAGDLAARAAQANHADRFAAHDVAGEQPNGERRDPR